MANPTLGKHPHATNTPDPIYGIRPGFTVGDLDRAYNNPLRVYGTWSTYTAGAMVPNTWLGAVDELVNGISISGLPVVVSPHARAVKISLNITGTGTVQVIAKSAIDITTVIFDSGPLGAGEQELYIGGWASPSGDGSTYQATRYGAVKPGKSPAPTNTTGDMETVNPDPAADSNYCGGTYNPFQFLSLDGYDLTFTTVVVGAVVYDMSVVAIS